MLDDKRELITQISNNIEEVKELVSCCYSIMCTYIY